jgi:periplasmic protein TonB
MQLVQDIRPLPREPQQRIVVIATVAALHIAVIAAFLSGLTSRVFPVDQPGPIVVKMLPATDPPPAPPPTDTVVLEHPTLPPADIPDYQTSGPTTIHEPPQLAENTTGDPPVRTFAAQPIVGSHTTPDYPPLDRRLGHEGNVLLKLTIDEWGAVTSAQVERSSGYEGLDRAAAGWVKTHWLYHPATRSGDPIPSMTEALVTFRLTDR